MIRNKVWQVILIILAVSLSHFAQVCVAQSEKPKAKPLSTSSARKLLKQWLSDDKSSVAAGERLHSAGSENEQVILKAIRAGVFSKPRMKIRPGKNRFPVKGREGVAAGHYFVFVPRKIQCQKEVSCNFPTPQIRK